jgi:hypothetical protein
MGQAIRNAASFPEVKPAAQFEVAWRLPLEQSSKSWPLLYPKTSFWLGANMQFSGNAKVLGQCYGLAPQIDLPIITGRGWRWGAKLGLGLGYVTQYYKKNNPENQVLGTPVNAYGTASTYVQYPVSQGYSPVLSVGLHHYSNGNFATPNLGINIYFASLGLSIGKPTERVLNPEYRTLEVIPYKKLRIGFRLGLSSSERAYDGPRYLFYSGSVMAQKFLNYKSRLSFGLEYAYSDAALKFQQHVGENPGQERKYAQRWQVIAGHELFFGRLAFLTEGGIYLNKYYARSSIIGTRIGFNYYLLNPYTRHKFNACFGLHVRANFGLAELVEANLGLYF